MKKFHLSLFSGRTDSLTVESSNYIKLKDFFNKFSSAIVRNIKEIKYSKEHNINYVNKEYVHTDVWKKVIVTAMSENHTKIYTLFDVKKTVTEDILKTQFLKLYIKNEPIIDFAYIEFFEEGVLSPIDITNLYQVQYKRNNKTKLEDIYSPSWETLKNVFDTLIGGELTEIREYKYNDYTKKDFSLDINRNAKVHLKSGNNYFDSFTIPKVKKNNLSIESDIKTTFKLNFLEPDIVKITY